MVWISPKITPPFKKHPQACGKQSCIAGISFMRHLFEFFELTVKMAA
jgi:hypothetical protein